MKVEFKVTADLDAGELRITCPDVFESIDNGYGPEIRTNYPEEFKQRILRNRLLRSPIRARFMNLAKFTKEELERAEAFGEDK